ncbi:hypothetical protein CUZ93_0289 [Enterococcus xinjiangensis]|nr:hypothetical protein [Enterococcus lactis]MBL4996982.1 hypothetical protein [Enterococcus lactis]MBL4999215.1 hypothetical protein [Enterococcus lactis]
MHTSPPNSFDTSILSFNKELRAEIFICLKKQNKKGKVFY